MRRLISIIIWRRTPAFFDFRSCKAPAPRSSLHSFLFGIHRGYTRFDDKVVHSTLETFDAESDLSLKTGETNLTTINLPLDANWHTASQLASIPARSPE